MISCRALLFTNRVWLVSARCLLLTVLCLITHHSSLITAFGQSATATLSGKVEDERGAVIPAVNITAINQATGAQRQTTTNAEGIL